MAQLAGHVAPEPQQAGPDVARQGPRPQDLGERPGGLAPPELELEESVPRHVEALGEEQVVFIPGVDMRDPPTIPQDLDGLLQPGDAEFFRSAAGGVGEDREATGHVQGADQQTPMSHESDSPGCSVGSHRRRQDRRIDLGRRVRSETAPGPTG